jgi:hypothetical protein
MITYDAEVPQLKLEAFGGFSFCNHGEKEFFHLIRLYFKSVSVYF